MYTCAGFYEICYYLSEKVCFIYMVNENWWYVLDFMKYETYWVHTYMVKAL